MLSHSTTLHYINIIIVLYRIATIIIPHQIKASGVPAATLLLRHIIIYWHDYHHITSRQLEQGAGRAPHAQGVPAAMSLLRLFVSAFYDYNHNIKAARAGSRAGVSPPPCVTIYLFHRLCCLSYYNLLIIIIIIIIIITALSPFILLASGRIGLQRPARPAGRCAHRIEARPRGPVPPRSAATASISTARVPHLR